MFRSSLLSEHPVLKIFEEAVLCVFLCSREPVRNRQQGKLVSQLKIRVSSLHSVCINKLAYVKKSALCIRGRVGVLRIFVILFNDGAGIAQSVQRLATGWSFRGPNSYGGEIFRTLPDRSLCPSGLLHNGYRVFPGGKAAWAWP